MAGAPAAFEPTAFNIGAFQTGEAAPSGPTPTGGWLSPSGFYHHETAEMRRRERERLGIIPKQQRAIDRAAVRIAAEAAPTPSGGLLAAPAIVASPSFDRLLSVLQPSEGAVALLVQAILDRMAWIAAEAEEEEAIVRMMMEMD
jgi:hypothetical protein